MQDPAVFQLENYIIQDARLSFSEEMANKVSIDFKPSGIFEQAKSTYKLKIDFRVFSSENADFELVFVRCVGTFVFGNDTREIPDFFYKNAIAILFPYLRAFVSTITVQANIPPFILPTLNLAGLEKPLRESTKIV